MSSNIQGAEREFVACLGSRKLAVKLVELTKSAIIFELEGKRQQVALKEINEFSKSLAQRIVLGPKITLPLDTNSAASKRDSGSGSASLNAIVAPMPGIVVSLLKGEGDRVSRGEAVVIIEAMKMENPLTAPRDGVIAKINVGKGQEVNNRQVLVELGE